MINKDANCSRRKDPIKNKGFTCHDRGYFAKVCPKSRKAKRASQILEETMVSQFLTKDAAFHCLHLKQNDIPKSSFNTEKRILEDFFTDGQPQLFIYRHPPNANNDFCVSECVKVN